MVAERALVRSRACHRRVTSVGYGRSMRAPISVNVLAINYPPEPSGNAPYVGALASELARRGFDVEARVTFPHYPGWAFVAGYSGLTSHEVIDGVRVTRFRHYVPRPPRGIRRLVSELTFGFRLLFSRSRRADVTIALFPALFAVWLATFRRRTRPLILWVQDIYALGLAEIGEGGSIAARITRRVEGQTLRRADRIVVIHERFRDRLCELYGLPVERVEVLRNWTYLPEVETPDRSVARAGLGWGDETIVLYTGNFGAKQGLETAIEAARIALDQHLPLKFVLMGGGGEESSLRHYASEAGLLGEGDSARTLEFLGPRPPREFRAALVGADVLLVCEKRGVAESSVPSKMATYFDAARPVIASTGTDGITASELRRADAGVVVEAGDPQALIDAALALRADVERSRQLGENGRRYRVEELGEAAAIDRWQDLIESTIPPGSA